MHKAFEQIGDALKSCHFRGSGKFYHRISNSHVILVQLATALEGEGFTVSYGRHPLLDDSNKVHHRDYKLENCQPHRQVCNKQGRSNWAYHMSRDEMGELIGELLSGINNLEG